MEKLQLLLIITVLGISLISYGSSAELGFYGIDSRIENSTLKTALTITVDGGLDQILLRITPSPVIKRYSTTAGTIACESKDGIRGILCKLVDLNESGGTIKLELESELPSNSFKREIVSAYEIPLNTTSVFSSLKLPPRAALSEDPPENSISPRNGEIKTDGRHIIIFWTKSNITAGDLLTFSASYSLPEERETPINTVLIIPIIVVLAAFVWLAIRHKKATKSVGESAAVSVLSKDEKTLFDILKAHQDKVNQKVIVRESNFSKAKVSRLLKGLKGRGVIDIEAISGRENRIVLKLGQASKKEQATTENTVKGNDEKTIS